MTTENTRLQVYPGGQPTTSGGQTFLVAWTVGLTVMLTAMAVVTISTQQQHRIVTQERHRGRMDPVAVEPGVTAADQTLPADAVPVRVDVGLYVDRISEFSIRDLRWTVDFYIWFRWRGDSVQPGKDFRVIDGWIDSKVKDEEFSDGDQHYERYRVVASITKLFDVGSFPRDEHLLTVNIENPGYRRHQLLFVPDQSNSNVSSRVRVPAYEVSVAKIIEKPHSYKTTRGDPRLQDGIKTTYSQARLGFALIRSDWGYFLKMFQSLYIAVTIAMLAMFIKPTHVDPRFGLGIGGLFAAVANSYATSSLIPDTGIATLADVVNGLGTMMILVTVIQSAVSLYIFEHLGHESLSRRFDRVSFAVLAIGYVGVNLTLPLIA